MFYSEKWGLVIDGEVGNRPRRFDTGIARTLLGRAKFGNWFVASYGGGPSGVDAYSKSALH